MKQDQRNREQVLAKTHGEPRGERSEPPVKLTGDKDGNVFRKCRGILKGKIEGNAASIEPRKEEGFQQYRRSQIAELRSYVEGENMERVSISAPDKESGSPKQGDMIARNPKNHEDQWLVAAKYFADNFEPIQPRKEERGGPQEWAHRVTPRSVIIKNGVVEFEIETHDTVIIEMLVERINAALAAERERRKTLVDALEKVVELYPHLTNLKDLAGEREREGF